FAVLRCDRGNRVLENQKRGVDVRGRDRQRVLRLELAKGDRLDPMDDAAASQWIEALQRFGTVCRLESIHGTQKELVRAGGKLLEGGHRVEALMQALRLERRTRRLGHARQPIQLRPSW